VSGNQFIKKTLEQIAGLNWDQVHGANPIHSSMGVTSLETPGLDALVTGLFNNIGINPSG
jgi:hypothetical protein